MLPRVELRAVTFAFFILVTGHLVTAEGPHVRAQTQRGSYIETQVSIYTAFRHHDSSM